MKRKIVWWLFLCFLSLQVKVKAGDAVLQKGFPYPKIPVMIQHPDDRRDFLLRNYWSEFDFTDHSMVDDKNVGEQGFVDFIALLADKTVSAPLREESMLAFCNGFLKDVHARNVFMNLADEYLYNPNSPLYSEMEYRSYLNAMLKLLSRGDAMRTALDFKLKLIRLNAVGTVATDFTYYTSDTGEKKLRTTPVKGNRLLLIFYDLDCEHCHAIIRKMAGDARLTKAVSEGKLTVLAVYTEGESDRWLRTVETMPAGWIVGDDKFVIKEKALYDLKAMPSFYLLDGEKKVLLKDAAFDEILKNISSL